LPALPMFPLGTVLFPHMVLPLHIFEPRYRALIQDVLDDSREFGVVLITRGHEVGGGDARSQIGTVAKVLQAEELEDGRWLAISVGVRRLRVVRWLDDAPYPRAEVEDVDDDDLGASDEGAIPGGRAMDVLVAAIEPRLRRVLAMHLELGFEGVPPTVDLDDDPEVACWQIAVVAPINPFDAQRVLTAPNCAARLGLLDELLADLEEVLEFQLRGDGRADADPA
jgi:uncharacterized protein